MELTRRRLLTSSALLGTSVGMSGCTSLPDSILGRSDLRVKYSGNVSSDEPLVEDAGLFEQDSYPYHYSRLITTEQEESEEIRWEYIEDELPLLVENLEGTDFSSEFLVFFGLVLPARKQLGGGSTSYEDDTLYAEYRVEDNSTPSIEIRVNTQMMRVQHDEVPEKLEPTVHFQSS